jgi:PHD-finger
MLCSNELNSSIELDVDEEDPGLMVMCETCKVWQHGICVNLSEDAKDQDYYCEQCRPDLHVDLLK